MMKENRKERAKRLYDKAKEETTNEYIRDMVYECLDAGLVTIETNEETGEELIKPTAYGIRLTGGNPADYGLEE